jgi:hypothetical protein
MGHTVSPSGIRQMPSGAAPVNHLGMPAKYIWRKVFFCDTRASRIPGILQTVSDRPQNKKYPSLHLESTLSGFCL